MYACTHFSVVKVHFSSTMLCGVPRKAGMFSISVPALLLAFPSFLLTAPIGTTQHTKCCRRFILGVTNPSSSLSPLVLPYLCSFFFPFSFFHLSLSSPLSYQISLNSYGAPSNIEYPPHTHLISIWRAPSPDHNLG